MHASSQRARLEFYCLHPILALTEPQQPLAAQLVEAGGIDAADAAAAADAAEADAADAEAAAAAAAAAKAASEEREAVLSAEALVREVARRRNFAIISHPDAGKTTLVRSGGCGGRGLPGGA